MLSFKLDPRTKLALMLMINVTLFGGKTPGVMLVMAAIPLGMLFASKKPKAGLGCTLAYIAAAYANTFLISRTQGILNILIVMFAGMLYRLMPIFIMGYYVVVTTTVSEFTAAMEKIHMPRQLIIPMSVMFRFFPTIGEEARAISDAMRMRGISICSAGFFKKPIGFLEYRMVPLMISTVKIGDELSAAALTRGLGNPEKRTNICKVGFGVWDIILFFVASAAFMSFIL